MVYKLNNINQVDILTTSKVDMQLPFFIFTKDNEININGLRGKVRKASILFDIEVISKYREQGLGQLNNIAGFTPKFLQQLLTEYGITEDEVRSAMHIGKYYHKQRVGFKYNEQGDYYVHNRYTTNY